MVDFIKLKALSKVCASFQKKLKKSKSLEKIQFYPYFPEWAFFQTLNQEKRKPAQKTLSSQYTFFFSHINVCQMP